MDEILAIIADPTADPEARRRAEGQLVEVVEPASFWTAIANSLDYSTEHRRQAVYHLFDRHVRPGIMLGELATILDQPVWLTDIQVVDVLGGRIPVTWTFDDTVFRLDVLGESCDGTSKPVYLRVEGKVDRQALVALLRGETVPESVRGARVLEVGLPPPTAALEEE